MTIYDVGLCMEQVEWNPIPNKFENILLKNIKTQD
jgi:hypothetical protein